MTDITFTDEIQPASGATFDFNGITISNVAPTTDQILTATSNTTAEWQTGASALKTTGSPIVFSGSNPPNTGDILFASSATIGDWKSFASDNLTRVRAATTENGTLASDFENGDEIDGVTLVTGDRILIKDQDTGTENGIYEVQATGAPVRATDFIIGNNVSKKYFWAAEGTLSANHGFIVTNIPGSDVVGTDNLNFRIFSNSETVLTVASTNALSVAVSNNVQDITLLPGIYNINATLTLSSNTNIRGSGNNTVLRAIDPLNTNIITINNATNVKIKDLQLDGNQSNVTTPGHLINIGGNTTADIIIDTCNFINSGSSVDNINITGATNLFIKDCVFSGAGNLGNHIRGNASDVIDQVSIKDCRFSDINSNKSGIVFLGANYGNALVDGCIIRDSIGSSDGIAMLGGYTVITNCIIDNISRFTVYVLSGGTCLLKNCHINNSQAIENDSDSTISVIGNYVNNSLANGINVSNEKSIIAGNIVENSSTNGISVGTLSKNSIIQSNILQNNSFNSIGFSSSTNNKNTRILENNSVETYTDSPNITVNGYNDIVILDPAGAVVNTATMANLNFGSGGHIIYIEFRLSGVGETVELTPATRNVAPSGAGYSRVDFTNDGDFAVFQWTIAGTGWNILDVSGATIVP